MSSTRTADRAYEPDVDTRFVAQVSRLGALADDVVIDIIRARAGATRLSESASLVKAERLIDEVVAQRREPADAWTHPRNSEAVRWLMRLPVESVPGSSTADDGGIERLERLSNALHAAVRDEASSDQLKTIRRFFDGIGDSTMHAARSALHSRGSLHAWLAI